MPKLSSDLIRAALIRAVKTMAQTALAMITVGQSVLAIDWIGILSISATAGVVSILTSISAGLPETTTHGTLHVDPGNGYKLELPNGSEHAARQKTITLTVNPNHTMKGESEYVA